MKKIIFYSMTVMMFITTISYGTLAYFSDQKNVHNIITTGGIDIALLEWANDEKTIQFPQDGIHNVMPSQKVTKIVEVKNIAKDDAYIRVRVNPIWTLMSNQVANIDLLSIDFNEQDWIKKDDYYYYISPLKSGEITKPLFNEVHFSKDMDNLYQNSQLDIDILAQAVQVVNNSDHPLNARGWPNENVEMED